MNGVSAAMAAMAGRIDRLEKKPFKAPDSNVLSQPTGELFQRAKDEKGSVLTIGTVTPAEEINVAKRMLAEKLLHLGLAHPPRHKQEWLPQSGILHRYS
jgi:hypothetical protein